MLGRIVKVIGLGGELKLLESQDFWAEALGSQKLELRTADAIWAVRIEAERVHSPGMRAVRVAGVSDREAAQALVGAELVLDRDALDVPEPETLRPFHWLGLRALLPDGAELGLVIRVLDMPAHDVLVVGGADGHEYMIPAVPEIVREVDLQAGVLRIDPPAGLLEL